MTTVVLVLLAALLGAIINGLIIYTILWRITVKWGQRITIDGGRITILPGGDDAG